jgi:hypothetical protein
MLQWRCVPRYFQTDLVDDVRTLSRQALWQEYRAAKQSQRRLDCSLLNRKQGDLARVVVRPTTSEGLTLAPQASF